MLVSLACSLALAALPAQGEDLPPVLAGEPVELQLVANGEPHRFEVVLATDGEWTVLASSAHGNPYLELLDDSGATVARDDDGGVEWNARLVVEGKAGESLWMVAGSAEGDGPVLVELVRGATELSQAELASAQADFLRDRGYVLLERGSFNEGARALHRAGQTYFAIGRLVDCQGVYLDVLAPARDRDNRVLFTVAVAHLGAVHQQFGELTAAESALEAALRHLDSEALLAFEGRPVLEMFVLNYLGQVQLGLGELERAERSLSRAYELARETKDRRSEVMLSVNLGELASRAGRRDEARERPLAAVEAARELGDAALLAKTLHACARMFQDACEYERARRALAEASDLAPHASIRFALLGARANLMLETGDALGALELYADVLVYARAQGARGLESAALKGIAEASVVLGDYEVARGRLEERCRMLREHQGDPGELASSLNGWARVAVLEGELTSAEGLLEEALSLARSVSDPELEAEVLSTSVALDYYREDYGRALERARALLGLGREHGYVDVEAAGLRAVAELELRTGDLAAAREASEPALALFRRLGNRQSLQGALLTSVEIAWREGDVERMAADVREAEECLRFAPRLDPERGALLRAQESYALWGNYSQDLVAAELARSTRPEDRRRILREGLRRAGLWKARSLWQGILERRRGVRNPRTNALRRERDDLDAEREAVLHELRDRLRQDEVDERIAALRARLEELDALTDAVSRELARVPSLDAALDALEPVNVERLAAVRDGDRVVIELVEGRDRLHAYRIGADGIEFVTLGERDALAAGVRAYLDVISRPDRLGSASEVRRLGGELYRALLEPLLTAEHVGEPLVIVPSQSLAALPFEALVVDAPEAPRGFGEVTFLLDRQEVTYVASTPVLALLEETGPRAAPGPALVLADALYGGSFGSEAPSSGRPRDLGDLPGTRGEALALTAELEAAAVQRDRGIVFDELAGIAEAGRSLSLSRESFELHLGREANPSRLRGELADYAIVHCAGHGWLDPEDWRRSGLVLSPDEAGDDFVSLAEILDLDLDADLAVLSACDTGRGEVQRGEGVRSLARAFQYAGARTVIASLWPVDDAATQAVMTRLYAESVVPGTTLSGALRSARLAVRRGHGGEGPTRGTPVQGDRKGSLTGHPYYWASFVMSGLPDATLSSSGSATGR